MKQLPLDGIRIIDFTWILAGPYATRILADFGAEVIKIQSEKIATGTELNTSPEFATWNRNKLGITLNMDHPEARELVLKLVSISDVVIQNFSSRVIENWGLTYEVIKKVNPAIIMLNLSGMGMTGPWKNYVALSDTVEALSGLTYLSSYDKVNSTVIGYAHSDIVAGLFSTLAILSALEHRRLTELGQYIDISEFETTCALLGPAILNFTTSNHIPFPQGNKTDYINAAPYGCYKCLGNDKWCVIAVFNDAQWFQLCRIMGEPQWTQQSRFCTIAKRKKYKKAVDKHIEEWTSRQAPAKMMQLLQDSHIPYSIVNNIQDLDNNSHLQQRNSFVSQSHPVLGMVKMDSTPLKLSRTPFSLRKAAPLIGEDNIYVFQNMLGMDYGTIMQYIKKGIIG